MHSNLRRSISASVCSRLPHSTCVHLTVCVLGARDEWSQFQWYRTTICKAFYKWRYQVGSDDAEEAAGLRWARDALSGAYRSWSSSMSYWLAERAVQRLGNSSWECKVNILSHYSRVSLSASHYHSWQVLAVSLSLPLCCVSLPLSHYLTLPITAYYTASLTATTASHCHYCLSNYL